MILTVNKSCSLSCSQKIDLYSSMFQNPYLIYFLYYPRFSWKKENNVKIFHYFNRINLIRPIIKYRVGENFEKKKEKKFRETYRGSIDRLVIFFFLCSARESHGNRCCNFQPPDRCTLSAHLLQGGCSLIDARLNRRCALYRFIALRIFKFAFDTRCVISIYLSLIRTSFLLNETYNFLIYIFSISHNESS